MTGTPGRPLSTELSEQLLSVAVDILAEEGWGRLNSDRIAARARAGKAGIYRRWPTMAALARDRGEPVQPRHPAAPTPARCAPTCSGWSTAGRARWTARSGPSASIVGAARHEEELRAGLDDALVRAAGRRRSPRSGARAAARGEPIDPSRLALLGSVLEAFWWQRYTAAGDGAMTPTRSSAWSTTSCCRWSSAGECPRPLRGGGQRLRRRRSARPARPARASPVVADRQLRRRPVHSARRRLHLAQQSVGRTPERRGAPGRGRRRRSARGAADDEGRGPRPARWPRSAAPPARGSAGPTASSAGHASSSASPQPALRLVDQLALVGAQRVRGRRGVAMYAAPLRADDATPTSSADLVDEVGAQGDQRRDAGLPPAHRVGRAVHPGRPPVEEEVFLRGEVVEHRLDGDLAPRGRCRRWSRRRSRARRTAAARRVRISSRVCAFFARPAVASVHPPSQLNHGQCSQRREVESCTFGYEPRCRVAQSSRTAARPGLDEHRQIDDVEVGGHVGDRRPPCPAGAVRARDARHTERLGESRRGGRRRSGSSGTGCWAS